MRNKIFIFSAVILFGIIVSYVVFSWTEPTTMPSSYKIPINTSAEAQDVAAEKPVIGNLNVEKLGGYSVSDILALIGGNQPASYQIVAGTSCPAGTILASKYYAKKTCSAHEWSCVIEGEGSGQYCKNLIRQISFSTGSGWALDPSKVSRWVATSGTCNASWKSDGSLNGCVGTPTSSYTATCQAPVTHVLCLTVDTPK